jgi:hypothetical protein
MSRMIGFDRRLQLEWLDLAAALCQQALASAVIANRLKERLAGEIAGPEARRKTVTVLLRIWVNVPEAHAGLRQEALSLTERVEPAERLWIHWGMALLAYPFFRDVAATVGQLGRLQPTFAMSQVRRRVIERWGQRTTLRRAVERLVRSYADWGVIDPACERGSYKLARPRRATDRDLAVWLLACTLAASGSEQVALGELVRLPYLFPFELQTYANDVRRSGRFEISRQGLDLEMVALSPRPPSRLA